MRYRSLIPYVGDKTARKRLEELFDRRSTTGFLLGAMIGGLVTTIISAVAPGGLALYSMATLLRMIYWIVGILFTVLLAVYWETVGAVAEDAVDEVTNDN